MHPRRRKWQPTPVILPGESHGQRSLAVYSPWGCKESDTTRWLNHHHQLTFLCCKAWLAKNVTFQAPLLLLNRHVWDLELDTAWQWAAKMHSDFPGGLEADSALPMPGARVWPLDRELDPTCRNQTTKKY